MFKIFEKYPNLKYGISEKKDGPMSLSEMKNRQTYFESRGFGENQIVSAKQVHSDSIFRATQKDIGKTALTADSLITYSLNLFLTITVADCFPVYFYNPKTNQAALAHSGWRGTVKNIARKTVETMGGNPTDILAGIGPGIQKYHFEIQNDILKEFSNYREAINNISGKIFVDLPSIIKIQLQKSGVKNIESFGKCTYCETDKYFSHRRDKSDPVQLMLAYIGYIKDTN